MPPAHCSACGVPFTEVERLKVHPHCAGCAVTNWQNPRPVVLLLQPVLVEGALGLAVAKRGIQPAKGGYALPGGFLEIGETTLEGACREFREESGTASSWVRPQTCRLLGDLPSTSGPQQLVFVQNSVAFSRSDLDQLCDTGEMYDWTALTLDSPFELCWPSHQLVAHQWLESQARYGFGTPDPNPEIPAFYRR